MKWNAAADQLHRLIIRTALDGSINPIVSLRGREGEYLQHHIQPRITTRPLSTEKPRKSARGRPPRIRIKDAYDYYVGKLDEETRGKDHKRDINRLIELANFVSNNIVFIRTLVDSEADAYTVFETLNDRGLDLSTADLVKNLLYSLGQKSDTLTQMIGHWEQMKGSLDENELLRFLRHFWLSLHEVITQRRLFQTIRSYLVEQKKEKPLEFAAKLASEAGLYQALIDPGATDPDAADLIDLKEMGIQQHLPLLLAAKSVNLMPKEAEKTFHTLVQVCSSLTVRYLIAGEGNPNRLESAYSDWARRVRREKNQALDGIREEAATLCENDDELIESFKSVQGDERSRARHVLRKIEEHLQGGELRLAGPSAVHIEHILPLNPSKEWAHLVPEDPEEVEDLTQMLGNLTLLDKALNREASNQSFSIKRDKYYSKSKISITKELSGEAFWNAERIQARQDRFAILAPKIWSF